MSDVAADRGAAGPAAQVRPGLCLRILSAADVECVHGAALEMLGERGAAVAKAAASAPRSFVLGARAAEDDLVVGAARRHLASGGLASLVRPRDGGPPRPATGADLEAAWRLADSLPEVSVITAPAMLGAGKPAASTLAGCLSATHKHVQLAGLGAAGPASIAEAKAAVRIAQAVAGGDEAARRRPPLSLCTSGDLAAALVFARAGLPVAAAAAATVLPGGAEPADVATPADVALALVHWHARVLAACAEVQLAAPGAPFLYLADAVAAGLAGAGPQATMFQIACCQLGARLGLPVQVSGMRTQATEPDWQACTEDAFVSLATTAAGADVTGGAGLLDGGSVFSAQQLVMDAEIFSWNAGIADGIPVDDETIALDVIARVGIGGNYLGQRHTRRHMKEVWRPRLLDRSMWDAWIASGREGAYEKAGVLADELLAEHQEQPLGDELAATLARIAAEAGV